MARRPPLPLRAASLAVPAALAAALAAPSFATDRSLPSGNICTTRAVQQIETHCAGTLGVLQEAGPSHFNRDDAHACQSSLEAAWLDCQIAFRRVNRPFPPPNEGTREHPAALVRFLRSEYFGVQRPNETANSDGVSEQDLALINASLQPDRSPASAHPAASAADALGSAAMDGFARAWAASLYSHAVSKARESPPGEPKAAQAAGPEAAAEQPSAASAEHSVWVALSERVTVTPNGDPSALQARMTFQRLAGDVQGAASSATQLLSRAPRSPSALRVRAAARLASGDAQGAAADAQRLAELDPQDMMAKRVLGQAAQLSRGAARINAMDIGFGARSGAPGIAGAVGERVAGAVGERAAAGPAPARSGPAPGPAGLFGEALIQAAAAAIVLPAGGKGLSQAPPAVRRWLEGLAPGPARFDALPATTRGLWLSALENAAIGRWRPALEDATLLTQAAPEEKGPWLLRSKVLGKLVSWKAAEADARKALEKAPEDPAALLELGYAQMQQGRAEEGLATIDRALALAPGSGLGQLYRAETLETLGRSQEAVSAYRLAASLDPVLRPLTDQALARLDPRGAEPERPARRLPPWRKTLLAVAALIGGLLTLAGARRFGVFGGGVRHEAAATALAARAPSSEPAPGDVLGGHFRVEKELARGGMGVVYLATDTMLQRPVAIKRLNREAYASADARRKFIQEAQLAARLKHANLAQIHSVFGDGELYLVFEYVEGKGLDAALAERGRLGLGEAREVVRQVCAGLAHAHEGRVIHRDLKPANVMLGADGTAKILDFGIAHEARTVSNATLTQAWGTPPYMAPEQEDGYVSPASDLYALGVMAYELLAGQRPFEGPNQLGLKRSGSFARLGGRHGLPPEVDRFFARALHPDPAQRFARASDFVNAFDELAGTPLRS